VFQLIMAGMGHNILEKGSVQGKWIGKKDNHISFITLKIKTVLYQQKHEKKVKTLKLCIH